MRKIATPLFIAFVLALLSGFVKSTKDTPKDTKPSAIVAVK
ncbi:MAG: hypothetical protein U0T72_09305 [Chitinophagales bacterium]